MTNKVVGCRLNVGLADCQVLTYSLCPTLGDSVGIKVVFPSFLVRITRRGGNHFVLGIEDGGGAWSGVVCVVVVGMVVLAGNMVTVVTSHRKVNSFGASVRRSSGRRSGGRLLVMT